MSGSYGRLAPRRAWDILQDVPEEQKNLFLVQAIIQEDLARNQEGFVIGTYLEIFFNVSGFRQGIQWDILKCFQNWTGHPMGCPKVFSELDRASIWMPSEERKDCIMERALAYVCCPVDIGKAKVQKHCRKIYELEYVPICPQFGFSLFLDEGEAEDMQALQRMFHMALWR